MEYDFCLTTNVTTDKGIDKGVGAVYVYGIGPVLPQYLPEDATVGEGYVLAHERETCGYAVDLNAVDVLLAVHAISSKADDDVTTGFHAFGEILCNSLYAA